LAEISPVVFQNAFHALIRIQLVTLSFIHCDIDFSIAFSYFNTDKSTLVDRLREFGHYLSQLLVWSLFRAEGLSVSTIGLSVSSNGLSVSTPDIWSGLNGFC